MDDEINVRLECLRLASAKVAQEFSMTCDIKPDAEIKLAAQYFAFVRGDMPAPTPIKAAA